MAGFDEMVQVPVPRQYVMAVYQFLARLGGESGGSALKAGGPPEPPNNDHALSDRFEEWTNGWLRKMVEQCPPAMAKILRALAGRPDEWLSTADLAQAISPDADWNTVAGTLGAFGRRVKSRYGLETWPFDDKHDHEVRGHVYRMPRAMAERIKPLLAGR